MKYIVAALATTLVASTSMAETPPLGTIVWEAGISTDDHHSNIQVIEISFSPILRGEQENVSIVGDTKTKRHFVRDDDPDLATFRHLELPEGAYVLSEIAFRKQKIVEGEHRYSAFCPIEETISFDVVAGETVYLGQFQLNEPSESPTSNGQNYVAIKGMNRSIDEAEQSKRWTFGTATLAPIRPFSMTEVEQNCGSSSVAVKSWHQQDEENNKDLSAGF